MESSFFAILDKSIFANLLNKDAPLDKNLASGIIIDIIFNHRNMKDVNSKLCGFITEETLSYILSNIDDETKRLEQELKIRASFKIIKKEDVDDEISRYREDYFSDEQKRLIAIATKHVNEHGSAIIISDDEEFLRNYRKSDYLHEIWSSVGFVKTYIPETAYFCLKRE